MGRFIVIEGLDGSGKTTQTSLLVSYLRDKGLKVKEVSFPSYGKKSAALVELYLSGELGDSPDDTNAYAASMFYAADRYCSYVQGWKFDYEDPKTILVATRYTTSNAYHQLAKLESSQWEGFLEWLYDFEYGKLGLPKPDDVVLLSALTQISSANVTKRSKITGQKKDIHELANDYMKKCYDAANYAADNGGWHRVNCTPNGEMLSREEIFEKVLSVLGL